METLTAQDILDNEHDGFSNLSEDDFKLKFNSLSKFEQKILMARFDKNSYPYAKPEVLLASLKEYWKEKSEFKTTFANGVGKVNPNTPPQMSDQQPPMPPPIMIDAQALLDNESEIFSKMGDKALTQVVFSLEPEEFTKLMKPSGEDEGVIAYLRNHWSTPKGFHWMCRTCSLVHHAKPYRCVCGCELFNTVKHKAESITSTNTTPNQPIYTPPTNETIWNELHKEFLDECCDKNHDQALVRVNITANDVFEWFRKRVKTKIAVNSNLENNENLKQQAETMSAEMIETAMFASYLLGRADADKEAHNEKPRTFKAWFNDNYKAVIDYYIPKTK